MSDNLLKTDTLITDEINSEKDFIKVLKIVKGVQGVAPEDLVTMKQLEDIGDQSVDVDGDNAFSGDNEFLKPVKGVPAENDDEFPTLAQLKDLIPKIPIIPVITGDMVINWQTDLVPGYEPKTYAEVFGNTVFKAFIAPERENGIVRPYEAGIEYTQDENGIIGIMTVSPILNNGKLTFK